VNFFAQASDGIRVGQWDLNLYKMKDIPFIVPPEEEQTSIINYIQKASKDLESLIIPVLKEIRLLQEYRTRLISDVVTGKVDVRDIEIPEYEAVPDDVTEDELDDENTVDDAAEEAKVK